ncbi:hypothetical protein [Phenylobacterium sp.]|uniref:hypothetical protein n=1 Tax=Phenylobacterium sp. TaxID=1871053 RepID=UPI001214BBB0|nr:hypothetical protein [Phenylobacterium sp.]THD62150.1 MAG: hypothetical protein E8A12_09550 [Phenylobacterium sp.]
MEKLIAGAVVATALVVALPAWAAAPDAPALPSAPDPATQTVVAQAHLIFAATAAPPVVSELTVIQQGGDFAVVRTSFSAPASTSSAADPAVAAPCPTPKDAPARKTRG